MTQSSRCRAGLARQRYWSGRYDLVEEAGEGRPTLEHIVHGLGGVGMARQPATLGAHPFCEVANERRDTVLACGTPVISCQPVDLALDREDRVDAAHGLDGQGRFTGRTKKLRRPWLQQAASVIGPGLRLAS